MLEAVVLMAFLFLAALATVALFFVGQVVVLIPHRLSFVGGIEGKVSAALLGASSTVIFLALAVEHYARMHTVATTLGYSAGVTAAIAGGLWSVRRGVLKPSAVNVRVSVVAFAVGAFGFLALCSRTSLGVLFRAVIGRTDWFGLVESEVGRLILLGGLLLLLFLLGRVFDRYSQYLVELRSGTG